MLHVLILTKRCESGKIICLRSTIVCLPVEVNHSITYHRQMSRVRIRLARSGDSRALAFLRYRFRTETESATEIRSRFLFLRCSRQADQRPQPGQRGSRAWGPATVAFDQRGGRVPARRRCCRRGSRGRRCGVRSRVRAVYRRSNPLRAAARRGRSRCEIELVRQAFWEPFHTSRRLAEPS